MTGGRLAGRSQAEEAGKGKAGDDLSPEEFSAAYRALPPEERAKLAFIEKRLSGGTTLRGGDLVNEAVCRTLLGKRRCGRDVHVVAYLVGVMRSLASHEREKHERVVSTGDADQLETHIQAGLGERPRAGSAEDALIDAQERARIIKEVFSMFQDRKEELSVLEGLRECLEGKELRDHTGLDQGDLDYAKKRIRKALSLRFPKGWRS